MIDQFIEAMGNAVFELKHWPEQTVQIFHHNDSDGLSSGAILEKTFTRSGYGVRRFSLEKPYPSVLKKIFEQKDCIIIFADFAGRIAPLISDMNRGRNLVLILDHHAAEPATDPKVHNLDPELYGLKGDRDITASTTCYLFSRIVDPANEDLAQIATIGAVGDGFFVHGCLASQNREVALAAARQGKLEIRPSEDGEVYVVNTSRGPMRCDELGAYLDTLGAAGFYQNGPDMGVRVCIEGISTESDRMVEVLRAIQVRAFEEEILRIREGDIRKTAHIQWFHVGKRFAPMGVKMIGTFCEEIRDREYIDPRRYIAAFQVIPNEIPGFGPITLNEAKISMRVSSSMAEEIRAGRAMGLHVLLPEATNRLGGFSDACHSLTAATTIGLGKETALIEEMEKIFDE